MKVVSLTEYKEKKQLKPKRESIDSTERMKRIRTSLEAINKLMAELKANNLGDTL